MHVSVSSAVFWVVFNKEKKEQYCQFSSSVWLYEGSVPKHMCSAVMQQPSHVLASSILCFCVTPLGSFVFVFFSWWYLSFPSFPLCLFSLLLSGEHSPSAFFQWGWRHWECFSQWTFSPTGELTTHSLLLLGSLLLQFSLHPSYYGAASFTLSLWACSAFQHLSIIVT